MFYLYIILKFTKFYYICNLYNFGYMVLDDEKHIIKESFKYGKVFNSMIATDKYIYAVFDSNIWVSPKDGNHFYISSFEKTNRNFNTKLVKLSDTKMVCGSGWCYLMTIGNDKNITDIPFSSIRGAEVSLVSKSKEGFIASFSDRYIAIDNEGNKMKEVMLPALAYAICVIFLPALALQGL